MLRRLDEVSIRGNGDVNEQPRVCCERALKAQAHERRKASQIGRAVSKFKDDDFHYPSMSVT